MKDRIVLVLGVSLLAVFKPGNAQFTGCFSAAGCSSQQKLSGPTTGRECCVSHQQGMYYQDGASCRQCVVYGWLSPEFVAPESVEMTNQPRIGFSKGADFSGLPSNLQVVMDVRVIQNTATLGSDFNISPFASASSFITITPSSGSTTYDVMFEADHVSQEGDETFQLELVANTDPRSDGIPAQVRSLPNAFFSNILNLTILDRTAITFGFTNSEYESLEGRGSVQVTIRNIEQQRLASPVSLRLLPLTVSQALQYSMENNRSLTFDTSMNTNAQESDFDRTPINVTFNSEERKSVQLPLTSDRINEPLEIFVAVIEVESAVDPSLITLGNSNLPSVARITITDDDEIQVGFESRLYQFNEPLFETQYEVAIVKSIPSEQSIAVDVTITANTAQHSTRDAIADFSVGPSLRLILSLPPERQKTNVYFSILSDMILESVEDFAITILPLENSISGYAPYTPGPITRTLVQILDTFVYVIGLEPVNQAVPESQGFAEVCARLLDPPANRTFADDVSFGVSVVATDGSAVRGRDYALPQTIQVLTNTSRSVCFNISVSIDNVYENNEHLHIQLIQLIQLTASGHLRLNPMTGNITISDTTEVVIGFIGAPYLAHENIGSMIFTVGVIGETTLDKNVVVSFSTSDGSTPGRLAVSGSDYIGRSNVAVTFSAGTLSVDIPVTLIEDSLNEGDEDFIATLTLVSGERVIVTPNITTATIVETTAVCQEIAPLKNGRIEYSPSTTPPFSVGTRATHVCNPGFFLDGNVIRVCQRNSLFNGAPPTCDTGPGCLPLPPIDNGFIRYAPDSTSNYALGTVATYACNAGFVLDLSVGAQNRTCMNENGGNTSGVFIDKSPSCVPIDCGLPSDPVNGLVHTSNGTTVGSVATFSCNTGYRLSHQQVVICRANGIWSPASPSCLIVDCGSLAIPANGQVDILNGTTFGSTATYTCNKESGSRTCGADGLWTSTEPNCQELSSRTGTCPSTGNVDTIVIAVSMAAGICVIISLVIIAVMLACNMHLRRRLKQYPNKDKCRGLPGHLQQQYHEAMEREAVEYEQVGKLREGTETEGHPCPSNGNYELTQCVAYAPVQ